MENQTHKQKIETGNQETKTLEAVVLQAMQTDTNNELQVQKNLHTSAQ